MFSAPRRIGAAVLATALGTIAALTAGEILLRIISPASLVQPVVDLGEFVRFHPRFGWINRAGASGRTRFGQEFDNRISINSRGLRDREVPYLRRPGVARVLAIGDSFTFGLGVETKESWPKVLEERLGGGAEVVNGGVPSWGTTQEMLWLEDEGFRYHPDVVVLAFYVNDFWDNAALPGDAVRPKFELAGGTLKATNLPLPGPRREWLSHAALKLHNHSLLCRLVERGWRSFRSGWLRPADLTPIDRNALGNRARGGESVSLPGVDVTGALLSEMDRACRSHGARLVVLLIPGHWQVRPERRGFGSFAAQSEAYAAVRRLCGERHLPVLDSYPQLAASEERGSAVYNSTDMHWNAAGNALVAGLLADFLRAGIL